MTWVVRIRFLDFLQRETHALDRKLFLMTAVAGTANALVLAVVNSAVEALGRGARLWPHLLLFGLILLLFAASLINYLDRSSISLALPLLSKDLGLGP